MTMLSHDQTSALDRLMRFLSIEGVTGQEKAIAEDVARALVEVGVPAEAIAYDDANTRIPLPTETGNLIVKIPGRGTLGNAPPIMFMTHLDTVPLCAGAKPRIIDNRIVSGGDTALGGDNRTGCAVLVTLAAELAKQGLDHPPLVLVFCVREESGLWGARHIDLDMLGPVSMGFNYDGSRPADVVTGAVGGDGWSVEIFGRASHAGVAPERGISASMVAAMALADAQARSALVRQGGEGRQGRNQQCRHGRWPERPRCGRRHQRRHRLLLRRGREPQPRHGLCRCHH